MNATSSASSASNAAAYGFDCRIKGKDIAAAVVRVTAALKTEGFGVLTEFDAQATLLAPSQANASPDDRG